MGYSTYVVLLFCSSTPHHPLLQCDATRRREPVILPVVPPIPRPQTPPPTRNTFSPHFLRKLLPSSSRTDAVRPIRTNGLRNPLDSPATAPLPRPHINLHEDPRPPSVPPTTRSWWPIRTGRASPAIVEVPLAQGKERNASADAPVKDDEWIRDEDCVSPPSPNPDSQRPSTVGQINTGEHGSVSLKLQSVFLQALGLSQSQTMIALDNKIRLGRTQKLPVMKFFVLVQPLQKIQSSSPIGGSKEVWPKWALHACNYTSRRANLDGWMERISWSNYIAQFHVSSDEPPNFCSGTHGSLFQQTICFLGFNVKGNVNVSSDSNGEREQKRFVQGITEKEPLG
ncbi:hypothetical protein DEU56DRAFT_896934 [Suillus clintonianus]|uniref:uncharacterized protein n=1 Tax=Suillus clintonianus TaxID=1904413 RepID=UPI001B863011|nr:uncharacterized protein DEU56DRAFT_896934 [Suillus clintonianus]KAG2157266.1 hypothetical protein DEU56DRAFT_896934 [Suillus clintonianus]